MKTLRLHFAIVVLCGFSFVLLAGRFTFRKAKIDLNTYEKPVTQIKDHRKDRLANAKEFKKISSLKDEASTFKNGR